MKSINFMIKVHYIYTTLILHEISRFVLQNSRESQNSCQNSVGNDVGKLIRADRNSQVTNHYR